MPTKVHIVKSMFSLVVMYGCGNCTIKKADRQRIDAFELWCCRRLLRGPWSSRSNQSSRPQYGWSKSNCCLKWVFWVWPERRAVVMPRVLLYLSGYPFLTRLRFGSRTRPSALFCGMNARPSLALRVMPAARLPPALTPGREETPRHASHGHLPLQSQGGGWPTTAVCQDCESPSAVTIRKAWKTRLLTHRSWRVLSIPSWKGKRAWTWGSAFTGIPDGGPRFFFRHTL